MEQGAQITALRRKLGESLSEDGDDSDSLFTDQLLGEWVEQYEGDLDRAALEGWETKMAHFANLVDVTDGAASRKLGDLMTHAMEMVEMYSKRLRGAAYGRARVGKIVRP